MRKSASQFLTQRIPCLDRSIQRILEGRDRINLGGMAASSAALAAAYIARDVKRPMLWIVKDQNALYDSCDDLIFFAQILDTPVTPIPFPHLETLPYEEKAPSVDIRSLRMTVWEHLLDSEKEKSPPFFVAPIRSLMKSLPPLEVFDKHSLSFQVGQSRDPEKLAVELVEDGYEYREIVCEPGNFCLRGGILDVYPPASDLPYRIEFFGDQIDSIRKYDPVTQRSVEKTDSLCILPGDESRLVYDSVGPDKHLESFLSLIPADTLILVTEIEEIREEGARTEELVEKMYREILERGRIAGSVDDPNRKTRAPIPPDILYRSVETIEDEIGAFSSVFQRAFRHPEDTEALNGVAETVDTEETPNRIAKILERVDNGQRIWLVCDNEGQSARLTELLGKDVKDRADRLHVCQGHVAAGFHLVDEKIAFITDREIFHRYKRFRFAKQRVMAMPVTDVVDLAPGDFIVHTDHGVGKYVGLTQLETDDGLVDFLEIVYADDDVLYVPIHQIDRIGKYIGTESAPPALSKLGGKAWQSAKEKARVAIEEMAGELIELYAERTIKSGYAAAKDTVWQYEFESAFPYEETVDQIRSIDEVKKDMESERPMDRLVCGDVGFGKTEVAIRAAFKTVMSGKQVAVLVPTTILAQQHRHSFQDRMAGFPVRVEMLSRFVDPKEQKETAENLAKGEIDIVVGTHRLLQKDVTFKDLGLVIIDEEQRFGVKHKERLKSMRRTVDVLTMTATPIPRTLYMALNGVRDVSLVNTPPESRLPIETYVLNFDKEAIESAILREMSRGGQVYFLHNFVHSIGAMAGLIKQLVPEARVVIGHGQMHKHELEKVMDSFIAGEYDVLVSTTIIESGIDIPNVNTIIINRADRFGLADLHQLRGRVGRERHQAYCYLLIPGGKIINQKARRRLLAVQEFNRLGSGFQLALRDLEIRGMGNLLGRQQHGHIAAIGFQLYNEMLSKAVKKIRREELEPEIVTSIDMVGRGGIDPEYVPSARMRMSLHKRLGDAKSVEDVDAVEEEMRDMFGAIPDRALRFVESVRLRIRAMRAGFEKVAIGKEITRLTYSPDYISKRFAPDKIIAFNNRWGLTFKVKLVDDTVILEIQDIVGKNDFIARLGKFLDKLAEI